ncbi:Peptidase M15 [Marinibacterium anthonyi]|nr:Peptidase M15 [Marinibacterium anthonyi]
MYSGRTGERVDMIYWIEGTYIKDALTEITHFMRDWRNDKHMNIDSRTVDIMAAAHNLMDVNEPYMLLSGYRSPETNAMLRRRSSGVAKNSLHMKGQAADLRLASRSVNQMVKAAMACHGGGVGKYSGSDFVHMDCGPVRHWGS